ncbi:MAG: hypothetical protein Q4B69_04805, partial [Slackia sp.]|nr:hypothetical protein [Slackia sp.]
SVLPVDAEMAETFAHEASDYGLLLGAGGMGMGVTLLVAAFILPFAMRYGMTKSIRVVPVVLLMLFPVSVFFLQQIPDIGCLLSDASAWLDQNIVLASVLFIGLVLAVYAASCAVAIAMYRMKEL